MEISKINYNLEGEGNVYGIMPMNVVGASSPVGKPLRVAVTKTSAQGKSAQSATPNLMSFSTDENSVWFNGRMYGVHKFNNVSSLNTNSTAEQVLSALNVSESSELYDLAHKGVLFIDTLSGNTIVKYEDGDGTFQLYVPSSDSRSIKRLTITVSSNKVTGLTTISHLMADDIRDTLTSTETNKALSAAMGKKLQDGKLSKTDVVNNLATTDTSKALSAAQGKALNDKISALGSVYRVRGSKTNISEVLALTDAKVGDAWNVTNAFTLGDKPYPANTNVVCITATSTSDHDEDNWDPIGGTVDLSPYARKTEVEEGDNEIWEQLGVVVNKDEIVNNLTSTDTDKPLSANMGKKLNDEKLPKSEVKNTRASDTSSVYCTNYINRIESELLIGTKAAVGPIFIDTVESGEKTITSQTTAGGFSLVWLPTMKKIVAKKDTTYYNNWKLSTDSVNPSMRDASYVVADSTSNSPMLGHTYVINGILCRWNGASMDPISGILIE